MALISLKICSPLPGITLKVFRCKRWQLKLVAARQHTKRVLSTVSRIRAEEDGISEENVKFEFANVLVKGLVLWIFIFFNSISIDGAIFLFQPILDFEPESFDVVYTRDCIIHIREKAELFSRFFKWLKPGGKLMVSGKSIFEHINLL